MHAVLSSLNRRAIAALPIVCLFGIAGCNARGNVASGSLYAPPAEKIIGHLSLPDGEREVLLRGASAALKRTPEPLPIVHTEGTLATLPEYQGALRARKDWSAMAVLTSAYAMTREGRYVEGYARYLAAWLDVYKISGNPIDETALGKWLLAYRSAGDALPATLAQRMRKFACDLADRYAQTQFSSRKTSTNNWQSHRVKLAVMGARTCGEHALISRAEAGFAAQISDNLLPGGETVDFAQRDAIHYVVYSVQPLLEAALFVAGQQGRPLFLISGPAGQSLSRTLEWLAPYARGDKTHEEFVHSQVRFDAQRAAAGVPGFAGPFSPKKAQMTYWLAAQMDAKWFSLSDKLGNPPIAERAPWLVR